MFILIEQTTIEGGYDEIIAAIDKNFNLIKETEVVRDLKEHLIRQKALAAAKRAARKLQHGEMVLIKTEPMAYPVDFKLEKGGQTFVVHSELAGKKGKIVGLSYRYDPKNDWTREVGEITVCLNDKVDGQEQVMVVKEDCLELA